MKSHFVCKSTSLCVEFNDGARAFVCASVFHALLCVVKKASTAAAAPSWINSTLIDKF